MDADFTLPSMPSSFSDILEISMEVDRQPSRFLSFSCVSELTAGGKSFSPDSYLASGSFKRYVELLDKIGALKMYPHVDSGASGSDQCSLV